MAEDFRQEPASARVAQGDTAVLRCLAPRGYPDPVTSWLRDGQPLAVGRCGHIITRTSIPGI